MLRILKNNDFEHLKYEMQQCNVDPAGINIMLQKSNFYIIKTSPLPAPGCNILKQQMLSIGGEVAIPKGCANCAIDKGSAIIMGTKKQLLRLVDSLYGQCFGLLDLQNELIDLLDHTAVQYFRVGERKFDLSQRTLIMGILNVTPDSFSDGGKFSIADIAIEHAFEMIENGADIIDIGGESTRPGAEKVGLEEELKRVVPVIENIRSKSDIPISIDTYKSIVAQKAIAAGANIVNDISGLNFDGKMVDVIAETGVSTVLMHIQGTPESMQKRPIYRNMIDEILEYLINSSEKLVNRGIEKSRIVLDPGIGFGKEWESNFDLIRYLEEFKSNGNPLLVGASRKSFIGNLMNLPVDERLEGSLASIVCSIQNGADIVRVHDVKESYRAVKVADKIAGKF